MRLPTKLLATIFFSSSLLAEEETILLADFETEDWGGWTAQGDAFGEHPLPGGTGRIEGQIAGYADEFLASSFANDDEGTGTLTSPEFTINRAFLRFLVGGGSSSQPDQVEVQLLINEEIVRRANGGNKNGLSPVNWDLADLQGQTARIRIVDRVSQGKVWGTIWADHFMLTSNEKEAFPQTRLYFDPENPPTIIGSPSHPAILVPFGSDLQLVAEHSQQGIHDITAIALDDQGHIYVTESSRFINRGVDDNRQRRYWIPDDVASQTIEDRLAIYHKFQDQVPLSYYTENSETVRRLVDTNGDFTVDSYTLFADGFNDELDGTASGVFAFGDTVYLASIPSVWALTDADQDGVAEQREALITGFGPRVSFSGHDLNGFKLGPDGRIYFTVGDRGYNIPTDDGNRLVGPGRGACFRCELDGSQVALVHDGLRNPKELAWDNYGNLVTVDNNSDQGDQARVVVIAEGADSGWRMGHQILHSFHRDVGIQHMPPKPWMEHYMWAPSHETHLQHFLPPIANLTSGPSGMVYLSEGSLFPEKLRNRFLICDYRGASSASGLWHFQIEPQGASWQLKDDADWFLRGLALSDIDLGPDGGLYLGDYMGGWSYTGRGRIWRLADETPEENNLVAAQSTQEILNTGFAEKTLEELAILCVYPDQRVRFRAIHALAGNTNISEARDSFARIAKGDFQNSDNLDLTAARLSGIWGLGQLLRRQGDAEAGALLLDFCKEENWQISREAIRAISDNGNVDLFAETLRELITTSTTNAQVLAEAVRSLADAGSPEDVDLLRDVLAANNNEDTYLKEAAVFALAQIARSEDLGALSEDENLSVRLGAVVALRRQASPALVEFLDDKNPSVVAEALAAINEAPVPEAYEAASALLELFSGAEPELDQNHLLAKPIYQWRLISTAFRAGTEVSAARLLNYVNTDSVEDICRNEALICLEQWLTPPKVDRSIGRYLGLEPRNAADVKEAFVTGIAILLDSKNGNVRSTALRIAPLYDVPLEVGQLEQLARNQSLESNTRIQALQSLVEASPANLLDTVTNLAQDSDVTFRAAVLETLLNLDQDAALAQIATILSDSQQALSLRQKAWTLLGNSSTEQAIDQLTSGISLLEENQFPEAEMLELIQAVEASDNATLISRLDAWKAGLAEDTSQPWLLSGGSVESGASIFTAGAAECAKCHSIHGVGGDAGPDLAGIANRYGHYEILENLVAPSAQIAPGWAPITLVLADDRRIAGTYWGEDEQSIAVELPDGSIVRIAKSDVTQQSEMVSSMPEIDKKISATEMRDVIAYLNALNIDPATSTSSHDGSSPTQKTVDFDSIALVSLEELEIPEIAPEEGTEATLSSAEAAEIYAANCEICHKEDGLGQPGFYPPLANSNWLHRPDEILSRVILHGLTGPIMVNGVAYNQMPMAPLGSSLNDAEIAAVLTYVRNSWGNEGPAVSPTTVAAVRAETADRIQMWQTAELDIIEAQLSSSQENPNASSTSLDASSTTSTPTQDSVSGYNQERSTWKPVRWVLLSVLVTCIIGAIIGAKMMKRLG